ncbi:MAG: DUF2277 domain-containing protein [Anaerolineales bacterium]|nr:DUF2277 domain-containing protein [Anaerolineales bacterium]
MPSAIASGYSTTARNKEVFMCRSIKPLRNMDHPVTEQEIYEAALQYVRKVSGYRKPSKANEEAFNKAIEEVADSTRKILANLKTVESQKSKAAF